MSRTVIQVEKIGKRYRIGQAKQQNALSHVIGDALRAPLRLLGVGTDPVYGANGGSGNGANPEVRNNEPAREMFVPAKTCLLDLSSVEAARLADAGLTLLGTSRLSVRREILNRIGLIPLESIFFDAPIFGFALALGGALILDRPLCYYRQHSQNLYAPIAMDAVTERRKFQRLGFLLSYVPPRLAEFGVAPDVIDVFVESPRVEFERARLYSGEGGRLEVFRTERRRFRAQYQNRSAGYRLFEFAVGACALILPPQNFYQLLGWYGGHNFARFRRLFGKAEPKVPPTFFQRLPVPERDLQSDRT